MQGTNHIGEGGEEPDMLFFPHEVVATTDTMQSVVTEQAPITLDRKITSGGHNQEQKIIHTITGTNRKLPQTKKRRYRRMYVSKYVS